MNEETKKGLGVINQIKKLLYNFDLALAYANGEIEFRKANMNLYQHSKKRFEKSLFVSNKVDKEKFELYASELEKEKQQIMIVINSVLDRYNPRYKKIFIMRFFEEKPIKEIADDVGYTQRQIFAIIEKLKKDFIDISVQ